MVISKELIGFLDFFKTIPDHRNGPHKLHSVEEILLVTFCGVIAGCEGWEDIELFGKSRLDFLRQYLPFANGVSSEDTLRRFFRVVQSFRSSLKDKVVAFDGKSARHSFDGEKKPLHLVSAFASEEGVVLGQEKVDDKTNEITAIPKLLEVLDLQGAIVTIDAMGCQYKIADAIKAKKAEYILALKGNQAQLSEDVKLAFEQRIKSSKYLSHEEVSGGHGRIETRKCTVTEEINWLKERYSQWSSIRSIVEIDSKRELVDKAETEKRYYISSIEANPEKILTATKLHWGIENRLHWVLDMSFGEDQSRIRKGNAQQKAY